jgi:uncharacterized protein
LEKIGVRHADIFGSVARREERTDSDVDILVDLDPSVVRDLFAYSRGQRTFRIFRWTSHGVVGFATR